jgi:hypothetical protein
MATSIDPQALWRARLDQRKDREWANRSMDERMRIAKLQEQADRTFQMANVGMPAPSASDTPDKYRVRMLRALLPSGLVPGLPGGPVNVPAWLDREPLALEKLENKVVRQVVDLARQRPTLQPIFSQTRDGQIQTEWIGQKFSWMREFRDQPKVMSKINGRDPVIPTR